MAKGSFEKRWLLIPKLTYLLMNFAIYCLYTYRRDFLVSYMGISHDTVVGAAVAICTFGGGLFWASVADKTGMYKTPLIICSIASCLSFFALYFFNPGTPFKLVGATFWFGWYAFFQSAFQPLCDNMTLRRVPDRTTYGRQKLFGSVAFAIITPVTTIVCGKSDRWYLLFPAMLIFNSAFVVFSLIFLRDPKPIAEESALVIAPAEKKKAVGVVGLFRIPRFFFAITIIFMIGLVRGIFSIFYSKFHKSLLHLKLEYSCASTVCGVLLEIVVFFFAGGIVTRFGVERCLLGSLVIGLVRIAAYLVLSLFVESGVLRSDVYPNLLGVIVCSIELLKGAIFGVTHVAAVQSIMVETPKELHSTAQAIYAGCYNNLAQFFVCLIGVAVSWICSRDDRREGKVMMVLAAVFSVVAIAMSSIRMYVNRRQPAAPAPEKQSVAAAGELGASETESEAKNKV